jgi:hypothetical protein
MLKQKIEGTVHIRTFSLATFIPPKKFHLVFERAMFILCWMAVELIIG